MFRFVQREKAHFPVRTMCRVLQVSASGYYAWCRREPSLRATEDDALTVRIRAIHAQSRGTYGAPRIHAELRLAYGIRCARKRVARLLREAGLQGLPRRRRRGMTRRDPARASYPDQVQRGFTPTAPNVLWVADITQYATGEGWLYLATVMDVFARRIVGWSMGKRADSDLVIRALNMAVARRQPRSEVIHHSDHGTQYTSLAFGQQLRDLGLVGSMGSIGDALDNAVAESFFATLQKDLIDRHAWATRRQLTSAIFEYIEILYNTQRRHSTLDYLTPLEYERRWQKQQVIAQRATA